MQYSYAFCLLSGRLPVCNGYLPHVSPFQSQSFVECSIHMHSAISLPGCLPALEPASSLPSLTEFRRMQYTHAFCYLSAGLPACNGHLPNFCPFHSQSFVVFSVHTHAFCLISARMPACIGHLPHICPFHSQSFVVYSIHVHSAFSLPGCLSALGTCLLSAPFTHRVS